MQNSEHKDLDDLLQQSSFNNNFLGTTANLVKLSNKLPSSKDEMQFYSRVPAIKEKLKIVNQKLITNMQKIFQLSGQPANNLNINKFNTLIDITDILLENVDLSLDKIKQANQKSKDIMLLQGTKTEIKTKSNMSHISRPQIDFKDLIDNSSSLPFFPKIKVKHNAIMPLDDSIKEAHEIGLQNYINKIQQQNPQKLNSQDIYQFPHPYQYEIMNLQPLQCQLNLQVQCEKPVQLTTETFQYIDNVEELQNLIRDLNQSQEIAVDLEHHSQRSFLGLTSLIQISTRQKDYIIDPFPIWREVHKLNEVFSNPAIIKVFHGADWDIQWLQRDFGIYVVNLFDTGQASRILQMQSFSLAFLLNKYCSIKADKQYQLADWTIRPLTKEMLHYAREDTHYLLYIYDMLRKDLINQASKTATNPIEILKSVLNNSKEISLKKYIKPTLKDHNYFAIMTKHQMILSEKKLQILQNLLQWRDDVARDEDVSPQYVMENVILFKIVNQSPLNENELQQHFGKLFNEICKTRCQQIIDCIQEAINKNERIQQQKQDNKPNINEIYQNRQNVFQNIDQQNNTIILQQTQTSMNYQNQISNQAQELQQNNNNQIINSQTQLFKISIKKLGKYKNSQFISRVRNQQEIANNNDNSNTKNLLLNVKSSFNYRDPLDLMCDLNPSLKLALQQSEHIQNDQINQNLVEIVDQQELNQQQIQQKPVEQIDFIEVPEVPQQNIQKKQEKVYRLPQSQAQNQQQNIINEENQHFNNDKSSLPIPLSEQQQIQLGRKKRKYKYDNQHNEDEISKKYKNNDNIYMKLVNQDNYKNNEKRESNSQEKSSSSDIEDVQQNLNFNEIMNKAADSLKKNIQKPINQFIHLNDPIDAMYRENDQCNQQKDNKKNRKQMHFRQGGNNKQHGSYNKNSSQQKQKNNNINNNKNFK